MDLKIQPLTPDLIGNFLNYFDNIGFTDNPEWAVCYCYFHHCPGGLKVFSKQTKEENRTASIQLINSGKLKGFIAYDNDKPVGWCKADLKENFLSLPDDDEILTSERGKIASIACFLIAPDYRKQGIARKLLEFACSYFKNQNYEYVEGYPRIGDHSDAHHYHGPLSLYTSVGFTVFKEIDKFYVVRKKL